MRHAAYTAVSDLDLARIRFCIIDKLLNRGEVRVISTDNKAIGVAARDANNIEVIQIQIACETKILLQE